MTLGVTLSAAAHPRPAASRAGITPARWAIGEVIGSLLAGGAGAHNDPAVGHTARAAAAPFLAGMA